MVKLINEVFKTTLTITLCLVIPYWIYKSSPIYSFFWVCGCVFLGVRLAILSEYYNSLENDDYVNRKDGFLYLLFVASVVIIVITYLVIFGETYISLR